jgi:hypothetical protein
LSNYELIFFSFHSTFLQQTISSSYLQFQKEAEGAQPSAMDLSGLAAELPPAPVVEQEEGAVQLERTRSEPLFEGLRRAVLRQNHYRRLQVNKTFSFKKSLKM